MNVENLKFENLPEAISLIITKLKEIENSIASIKQQPTVNDPEAYIYGINGLAKFLNVSTVTAQSIKNSGKIPCSQIQRTIIFEKSKIIEALSINKNERRKEIKNTSEY
jgi:hypothetical protein